MDVSSPAISTAGLTKAYGELVAVDHLDLQVGRGEIFGLLGPNGAGKTTTILMLLGLTEPTSGQASVIGLDPVHHPLDVKRVVGYLPDNVGFYADLTGRENLRYTARLNGMAEADADTHITALLDEVGLNDAADRKAGNYSKGMRQRLGIADALVKRPQVLILDEPTIGLDPQGADETLQLIRRLATDQGVTVLLSSHLLHQVQTSCDRMAIFVKGKIVASGRLGELADARSQGWVSVEVDADDPGLGDALRGLPDARRVEREGTMWVVSSERDLREDISRLLAQRVVTIRHLKRRGVELDDVYRRYFE